MKASRTGCFDIRRDISGIKNFLTGQSNFHDIFKCSFYGVEIYYRVIGVVDTIDPGMPRVEFDTVDLGQVNEIGLCLAKSIGNISIILLGIYPVPGEPFRRLHFTDVIGELTFCVYGQVPSYPFRPVLQVGKYKVSYFEIVFEYPFLGNPALGKNDPGQGAQVNVVAVQDNHSFIFTDPGSGGDELSGPAGSVNNDWLFGREPVSFLFQPTTRGREIIL